MTSTTLNLTLVEDAFIHMLMDELTKEDADRKTILDLCNDEYSAAHDTMGETALALRSVKQWHRETPTDKGAYQEATTPAIMVKALSRGQPEDYQGKSGIYILDVLIRVILSSNERMTQIFTVREGETDELVIPLDLDEFSTLKVHLQGYVACVVAILDPLNRGESRLQNPDGTDTTLVLRFDDDDYTQIFFDEDTQGGKYTRFADVTYSGHITHQ